MTTSLSDYVSPVQTFIDVDQFEYYLTKIYCLQNTVSFLALIIGK